MEKELFEQHTEHEEESDKLIQDLFGSSQFCCQLWSRGLEIIACNEACVKLFKLKNKQEFAERFFELSPEYQPDGKLSSEEAVRLLGKAFDEGFCKFEWMHRLLDGGEFACDVTLIRVRYRDEFILAGYFSDFRGEKELLIEKTRENLRHAQEIAEERTRANERISLMLNATPLACTIRDGNFNIFECNDEAVRLYGFKDKREFLDRFHECSPEYQPNGRRSDELAAEYVRKAYEEGKFVFEWIHKKLNGTLFPAEITLIRVGKPSSDYTVVGYTRDLREQKRMMEEIEKRDILLYTVNQAAEILLQSESDSFDATITRCTGMIGTAVGADRVSIWRNYTRDGRLGCEQIHEWLSGGSSADACLLVEIWYDSLPGWEKTLSRGDCISSRFIDMSPEEQELLAPDNVLSLFVVPVFTQDDNFWGFVCFDNCHEERIFSETEQSILRSGSLLIAHTLVRHKMNQNIRENAALLQNVAENQQGLIWQTDRNEVISFFNGKLLKKLGVTPDRIVGKSLGDMPRHLMHPEIAGYVRKTFTEGAQEWISETERGAFHFRTSPVYGDDGNIISVVSSVDEITEIIRLQDELKESLGKANEANTLKNIAINSLESILNSIDAIIYATVPETGEILFINDYMQKLLNKSDSEVLGGYCYKVFRSRDDFCDYCPCHQLDENPEQKIVWDEFELVVGRHLRHSDYYIDWPNGQKVHLQHAVDITELVAAREAAEQGNRSKGVFIAQMSHEIRTPMSAILGIAEIQLHDGRLSAEAEEGFKQIYDSGNLLLNIINDILDFSKIDAGKMEIIPNKYDIPSLVNDTVQLCRLRYESKLIDFNLRVDENTPLELIGDELRIRQILNNLLSNAFKYTDTGEVALSIAAEPEPAGETVTLILIVSDTGQGMTEEQTGRIFDEYSRFNMEKNNGIPGTGLGMNITKRLIDMMGGEILVESEIGKGSAFTVRLPQKGCGSVICGAEIVESLRSFNFSSNAITKKAQIVHEYMPYGRVLVVDDVESNLFVARGLLLPYGLQIETVKNGFEAVDKIKDGEVYDIVFMDHMMPVMDGIKTTKILRDLGYTHPIVALTANAITGQSEMFLSNGFDRFISKPIDSRELDLVLTDLIRNKKPPEILNAARRLKNQTAAASKRDAAELEKYFIIDAEGIADLLEKIYARLDAPEDTDIESYTTAVHGIKSALKNVGKTELSEYAFKLEQAGQARDFGVIAGETPEFISRLKALIAELKPKEVSAAAPASRADTIYLKEQLDKFKTACEAFHIRDAEAALNDLKQRTWPRGIDDVINELSVALLRGEFKKAVSYAEKITNTPDAP